MVNCCLSIPERRYFPSFPHAAGQYGFNSARSLCRCSTSALVFSDYSRITVGCTGCCADNQPLTVPFHSADVFISAALSQSRLLNLKTLFTIKSNYSAWLHWGIQPCPRCFLRLPAPSAVCRRQPVPGGCSTAWSQINAILTERSRPQSPLLISLMLAQLVPDIL